MSTDAARFPAARIEALRDVGLSRSILVATNELAERYREAEIIGVEGVDSERRLKPYYDDCETK
jgi:hypothetical protein